MRYHIGDWVMLKGRAFVGSNYPREMYRRLGEVMHQEGPIVDVDYGPGGFYKIPEGDLELIEEGE